MATVKLSTKATGSIVKIKESGTSVDFYVAQHNYESGLNGSGRSLLVRKDCYNNRQWHTSYVNAYASSAIDSWLNSTYKSLFPADIQAAIGTTKFYYTPGNGNTTVTTLQRAIFLLSVTELGKTASYANMEGSALPKASELQIAKRNGSAVAQWTRSPYTSVIGDAHYLNTLGYVDIGFCTNTRGSRPAFTLPSSVGVDSSGNIVLNQPPPSPKSITVPQPIKAGNNVSISWTASTDPDGNLSGYKLERKVDSDAWTQIYQGGSLSFADSIPFGWGTVQYRVKAYDSEGAESSYTTSSAVPIVDWRGFYVKQNGSWIKGDCYLKQNGVWEKGSGRVKQDGSWKGA